MVNGVERRKQIIELLLESDKPLSGSALAIKMEVSRQVIVQDIALLRATNKNILSTNKGYIIYGEGLVDTYKETIAVNHDDEQILDELYTIVDGGGEVLDVVVEHDVYGQISVDLVIKSRKDADEFVLKCKENNTKPLKELTDGIHYHTIQTESKADMNEIVGKLKEKGYLLFDS